MALHSIRQNSPFPYFSISHIRSIQWNYSRYNNKDDVYLPHLKAETLFWCQETVAAQKDVVLVSDALYGVFKKNRAAYTILQTQSLWNRYQQACWHEEWFACIFVATNTQQMCLSESWLLYHIWEERGSKAEKKGMAI